MVNQYRFLTGSFFFSLTLLSATLATEKNEFITLYYNERPPYLQTLENGEVAGLTATPAAQALQKAGIAFKWTKMPSNRQIQILERNVGQDCMVGWFKNPQRELIGNFSLPLYRDKPTIGLALFSNPNIDSGSTLEQVLQNRDLRLLVKDGYSYGEYIDGLIHRLEPNRLTTTTENINMLRMLSVDRADYFLIAEEEAQSLILESRLDPLEFKYIHFSDSPDGGYRYLWCSKQVTKASLDRINQAITEVVGSAP
ncbi:substrate-binding periplasmic protein [Aeromonas australiensis]|uniref:substrate-binding periplasmic protein n=1 Tax=Aeromonas australiensis TaxID=1114880 RepID=UPI0009E30E39|nr:transporter substrate-binding domain-containing protein [Aeromonas australiensis]